MRDRMAEKRILFSEKEDQALDTLLRRLSSHVGCKVTMSRLVRSSLLAVRSHMPGVLKAADELGPMRRPSNRDQRACARFQKDVAEVISRGVRKGKARAIS